MMLVNIANLLKLANIMKPLYLVNLLLKLVNLLSLQNWQIEMVQISPYRNAKLTQFVFKQNLREDPLLTALHFSCHCNIEEACALHLQGASVICTLGYS